MYATVLANSTDRGTSWSVALCAVPVVITVIAWIIGAALPEPNDFLAFGVVALSWIALSIATSLIVVFEAARVGRSRAWALGTLFAWPICYPMYLHRRRTAGRPNLLWVGIGAVLLVLVSLNAVFIQIVKRGETVRHDAVHHVHEGARAGEFGPF